MRVLKLFYVFIMLDISAALIFPKLFARQSVRQQGLALPCSSASQNPAPGANDPSNSLSNAFSIKNEADEEKVIPTYGEYFKFGIPTLGIWLLQPILSLIDTTVIGMSGTTTIAELAALGPGIGWVDSTSYLFYFMGVATTSLFSTTLREHDSTKSRQVLINGISLALLFGILLSVVQFSFAPMAITTLAGASTVSIPYGIAYSQIRSFAAPAALFTIVAQAAFLAAKDSITPLFAVIVGGLVNVVGDVWMVSVLKQGIRGAAWATTYSQYAGAVFLFFTAVLKYPKEMKWSVLKYLDLKSAKQFLSFCGPMFFILLTKSFLWTFTTFAAGNAGPVQLAAHQITLNFFLFFCIFGDVISQISQTYLPYAFESVSEMNVKWGVAARKIVRQLSIVGTVVGLMNMILSYAMNAFCTNYVTKSVVVAEQVKSLALYLAMCAMPHCLMLGYEGTLIAARDVKYLMKAYLSSGVFFIMYQMWTRLRGKGALAVWYGLVTFQWVRLAIFSKRVRVIIARKETMQ